MRHKRNLRRKPLARPQRRHRLCCRTANFGFLRNLAIHAVVATQNLHPPGQPGPSIRHLRNGIPKPSSSTRASSSVRAVVTMQTFMPLTFCTLVTLISGKIKCSRIPSV